MWVNTWERIHVTMSGQSRVPHCLSSSRGASRCCVMMSTKVLGLGPTFRRAALNPRLGELCRSYSALWYYLLDASSEKPGRTAQWHWQEVCFWIEAIESWKLIILLRLIQTESLSPSASEGILNKQRLSRPMSPHLTIYQPQLTSVVSIFNRFAGAGLGVRMYPSLFSLQFQTGRLVVII